MSDNAVDVLFHFPVTLSAHFFREIVIVFEFVLDLKIIFKYDTFQILF